MKIAIICNSYPTKKNKINQIFIKNLVDELNKDSIQVKVFYNKIYDLWGNASNRKKFIFNLIKYLFFFLSQIELLFKIKSFNVLNPHGVMISGFIAVIFKKIFHIPVILHVHGGDLNIYPSSNNIYKKIYRFTIKNCDFIFANSTDVKIKILKYFNFNKKNLSVLSPGVNYNKFFELDEKIVYEEKIKININPAKFILMFAGSAIPRKGLDILVNGLSNLSKNNLEKIHLLICSDGPELESNKKKLKAIHHLGNSIFFLKKVNQEKLNILYNIADIFVFPSREEPLGLVGLEAIASGTPVIGSNVGGIKEYINNKNGFLFNPNKDSELTKLLSQIIQNPIELKRINKNIDKRQTSHDILISKNTFMNKVLEIINKTKKL